MLRDDILVPTPGPLDVLIKVHAAGVNNTDINTRIGWYSKTDGDSRDASWSGKGLHFPRIQGADVCGEVVAVGAQADPDLLNKRVLIEPCLQEVNGKALAQPWYFGSECDGGFAEYTVVAARHAHAADSALSDVELASFSLLLLHGGKYADAKHRQRKRRGAGHGSVGRHRFGSHSTGESPGSAGHCHHFAIQGRFIAGLRC